MTKRRSQAERGEATEDAMIRAAIPIIASEGPVQMTLDKVGKAAGYTGGAITYRYGSKTNFLKAVCKRILDIYIETALNDPVITESEGLERLKNSVQFYLTLVRRKPRMMIAHYRLLHASHTTCPELLPAFREFDHYIRAELSNGIRQLRGIDQRVDVEAFSAVILSAMRGTMQQYIIQDDLESLERSEKMILTMCDKILRSNDNAA